MDEGYYQTLSLPPAPLLQSPRRPSLYDTSELHTLIDELDCKQSQQRLREAIDRLAHAWSTKHDTLSDALQRYEKSQAQMLRTLQTQTDRYQKAVREMQFYRAKYERCMDTPNITALATSSSTSQLAQHRRVSSDASEASISIITARMHRLCEDGTDGTEMDKYDIEAMLNTTEEVLSASSTNSERNTLALSPTLDDVSSVDQTLSSSSSLSAAATVTTAPGEVASFVTAALAGAAVSPSVASTPTAPPRPVDSELRFACTEGFWDTIARGKSNKEEVDSLISKYLRNGGQPNVAKISTTIKSVREGYSLVHALIAVKNTSALIRVIEAGADVNAMPLVPDESPDMVAPVVLASRLGYLNGIKALSRYDSCDLLQARGANNECALHAAVESDRIEHEEHLKVARHLMHVTQGQLLERVDVMGATPLHYACRAGKTRHVALLLQEFGARSDPRDIKGETPLHYAVRYQRPKVLACLIELGVSPNSYEPKKVPTPLDMAKSIGLRNMADFLAKAGGKTTKEMEKQQCRASTAGSVSSSNASTVSGGTSSGESVLSTRSFFGSITFRSKLDSFIP